MNRKLSKLNAFAGTFAIAWGIMGASSAYAQSSSPADKTTSDAGTIPDIVVTATRQSASMQQVPIAITALSTEALTRSNAVNLQNVATLSPGLQIQPQFKPGDAIFEIRGQVQTDSAPTVDPSVGVYFDDVYIARSAGSLINLVDVARVEVLKGPQGTLFGKNTTGGAIRIVSNEPTQKLGGFASGEYESFDRYRLTGVLNVPVSSTLAFRFSGQYDRKNGGYAHNTVSGNAIDKGTTGSLRGSLLWQPTPQLKVLIEGDYSKTTGGGLPAYLRYYVPANGPFTAFEVATETAGAAFAPQVTPDGTRSVGTDLRDVTASSYTFDPATGKFSYVGGIADPQTTARTWGVLGNVSYDFGFATLKSITAYRALKSQYSYDVDGTSYAIIDSLQYQHAKQFSQELLLNGKAFGNQLDWTVGGLYFNETPFERDIAIPLAALSYFGGSAGTDTQSTARNKSYGVFAQGTYKLTDQLSLTAGARYSIDKRGFDAASFARSPAGTQTCQYTPAGGFATGTPGLVAPCNIIQDATFKEWSYTASLNYQIDRGKLVYLRTSRGYRAGGFNPRINAPEVISSFKPEIVTDYELGIKADWLDHTLRTNLAVFHSIGSDVQQTVNGISPTNGAAITLTENIGKRKVDGFELSLTERPTRWLSFDQSVSYLHARSENPVMPDDTAVQLTPPWSLSVGANLDTNFSDRINGHLRVDVSYRDKMRDGPALRDGTGTIIFEGYYKSVTLLGARYTLKDANTGIEVYVYGRNLTNKLYDARAYNISGLGIGVGVLAEPRVIGAGIKIPFGAGS